MTRRLVYETHMHTPLCHHAEGEPEEYAAVAERRGLRGIIVTCHNPMPTDYGHAGRMKRDQKDEYLRLIERAREAFADRIEVRPGLECDFFPGYEKFVEQQLDGEPYEHVLGSVHPHLPIWRRRFARHGAFKAQQHYFEQLARSAESRLFDTLSHPDLIKNMTAEDWDPQRLMDLIGPCLDRIATTGTAMELNTSGLNKHLPEMNPAPAILREMCQRSIPVVVGADAHVPERVADRYEQAYDLLEEAGYTHVSYFLERHRHELPIKEARASLMPESAAPTPE